MNHHRGQTPDFLIVGAGIFGLTSALALNRQGYAVRILNPGRIPHPHAASTDISKVVRMEYGTDVDYMKLADAAIDGWHAWNELFKETLYHETGFILTSADALDASDTSFESACYSNLLAHGYTPERLIGNQLSERYPAFSKDVYPDGFYHARAGYAESGRTLERLVEYALQRGITVHEEQGVEQIRTLHGRFESVVTESGDTFYAGQCVVAAGNSTPYLLPELAPFFRITGHPVFHIKPGNPDAYAFPNFTVFAADISQTGWYGFPLHPKEKVVKIGHHGVGTPIHPLKDKRIVKKESEQALRRFLEGVLPGLANDPIVYTRLCCYTDTLDGHFWIDRHPDIEGLTVASGGSGHGFKMGPVIGEMVAAVALGERSKRMARYRWRTLGSETEGQEEARSTAH